MGVLLSVATLYAPWPCMWPCIRSSLSLSPRLKMGRIYAEIPLFLYFLWEGYQRCRRHAVSIRKPVGKDGEAIVTPKALILSRKTTRK